MRAAVVGCGYVGLATGLVLAYLGNEVACLDADSSRVQGLRRGRLPFYEPGLQHLLEMGRPLLRFTSAYREAVLPAEVIFIAVGTPSLPDGSADTSQLRTAAAAAAEFLRCSSQVVVVKSTAPIGAAECIREAVNRRFRSGRRKRFDDEIPVVSCPEFLREGHAVGDSLYPDRIVIGTENQQALRVLTKLYGPILDQSFPAPAFAPRPRGLRKIPLVVTTPASAELIKYAANSFLALKISFINEIAGLAERTGADIAEVACGMGLDRRIGKPFLQAGIGWGGSCFGKDSSALLATARSHGLTLKTVEAARLVNYNQRARVVEVLEAELGGLRGRVVTLLGLAFKPDTDDLRDAPALDIASRLVAKGARVRAHDPVAIDRARVEFPKLGITYHGAPLEAVEGADAVVLATEWPLYGSLDWTQVRAIVRHALILDGRNYLNSTDLQALGFRYLAIGRAGFGFDGVGPSYAQLGGTRLAPNP